MPTERLTPEERKARREERRLKAEARAAEAKIEKLHATESAGPARQPVPTIDLARALIARAQSMGREADLYYQVHLRRWPHRPSTWTREQIAELAQFLDRFIRPDGTPQPVPHRKRR